MEQNSTAVTFDDLMTSFKNNDHEKLLGDLHHSDRNTLLEFSLGVYGSRAMGNKADAARSVVNNIILERLIAELIKVEESISAAGKRIKCATVVMAASGLVVAVAGLLHAFKFF